MAWATIADVESVTGQTVTAANLAAADSDICVYAERAPSASAGMGPRDLYWLQVATSYQAVWRTGQVDVDTRQSVGSFSQDGIAVDYGGKEWRVNLAPMAARALKNLSWKGTRTSRTPNVRYPLGLGEWEASRATAAQLGFLDESYDEASSWRPL
jgi:hypothetical protein